MEKKTTSCLVLAFGLMIILVQNASASSSDDITCEEDLTQLLTCNPYFLGIGPSPSPICGKGVQIYRNKQTPLQYVVSHDALWSGDVK
ncbi:hypothetical protein CFP56_043227 [Quercus suber]|uniref:Uncharacterized protein n=1 Tax=Quercus suber TaxID=58331 RepID=A0AAW0IRI1_QUESU